MGHGLPEDGDGAAVTRAPSAQHHVSDTTLPITWTWVDTGVAGCEATYPVCSLRMAVTSYKPEPGDPQLYIFLLALNHSKVQPLDLSLWTPQLSIIQFTEPPPLSYPSNMY